MKVLSAQQIRAADAYTINNEPITSLDLMERASRACTEKIIEIYNNSQLFVVFCGIGNNGGDGLVIARLLHEQGKSVEVYLVEFSNSPSPDNLENQNRLASIGVSIHHIKDADQITIPDTNAVIIDALVGTGLTRPLEGMLLETVKLINQWNCPKIAVDLPSGLYTDEDNAGHLDSIFKADVTLSFEVPKINFFLPSMHPYVGHWVLLDIGLNKTFIDKQESSYTLVDAAIAGSIYRERSPFDHKGTFGHALIAAGSRGKIGAALLSASSCLRSGAGLVSAFVPNCGYEIMQTALPEAMVITSESRAELMQQIDYSPYTAIGTGPGIGKTEDTKAFLRDLILTAEASLTLDADALNIIAEEKWHIDLPENSLLTPHVKEFERLFGASDSCFQRLQKQREASQKYKVFILLKGRNSSFSTPDGHVFFNSTGNPGMATAGSGDVLTGLITGLRAQGYSAQHAGILGMYIHGLAGDLALQNQSMESLIASDLIKSFGEAFNTISSSIQE